MIAAISESIRSRWQAASQQPFFRLLRHCIDRIFYGGEGSADGEMNFGIGVLLAILAAPGAFISFALSSKYGSLFIWLRSFSPGNHESIHFDPFAASLPDEYFFIVLSMVVAGSVAVWKWDSLLPDRRDYANLVPLPIPGRRIFAANLMALLLLAAVLSIDINAASSVLFPLLASSSRESASYTAIFFATHSLSVLLAAAFGFFGVLAVLGVLTSLLPYRTFRKSSVYIRSALLIFFAALLMTAFSEPQKIQRLSHTARSWTAFPPPAWFAGLCQSLRGLGGPLFPSLGRTAIAASICVLLAAVGAYAISYGRCFRRSAETMLVLPAGGGLVVPVGLRLLDKIALRGPVQRAGYRFVSKVLFRSETHALTWIGFTAVGVMVVSNTLLLASAKGAQSAAAFPSTDILGVPLVVIYFLLFGLRIAFEIPAPLRANWVFRLGVDPSTHQCVALARRVMFTFVAPVLAICLGAYGHFWGWRIALVHVAVVAAMSALLGETLLLHFRKIPFTCSAPPFKDTTIVGIILCVLGLFAYSGIIPALEHRAFDDPFPFDELIAILLFVWAVCLYVARQSLTEFERRLIFDDPLPPAVETLDLTFRR